jgi:recombination protein U
MAVGSVGHANRGSALEQAVEQANAQYAALGIARITKNAVPTKVLPDRRADAGVKVIRQKSIVDYSGVWLGRSVAFDCKENREATYFPLKNVHEHQVDFLAGWEQAGGIAFLLVYHEPEQAVYLLPYLVLACYWADWKAGTGRASIPAWEFKNLSRVRPGRSCTLDYLATLDAWLKSQNGGH